MTAALTPELALSYVRELSADIREGAVLDAAGTRLAGSRALVETARDLLASARDATAVDMAMGDGTVFAARSERHAIVVACGPHALPSVVRFDLRTALDGLAAEGPH